jgi:hypothetical protein
MTKEAHGAQILKRTIMKHLGPSAAKSIDSSEGDFSFCITEKVSSPITVKKIGKEVRVSKATESGSTPDFELRFLLWPAKDSLEWWPVELLTPQRNQCAETIQNGRRLINVHVQNELVDIANAWGKNIDAQRVIKDIPQASSDGND